MYSIVFGRIVLLKKAFINPVISSQLVFSCCISKTVLICILDSAQTTIINQIPLLNTKKEDVDRANKSLIIFRILIDDIFSYMIKEDLKIIKHSKKLTCKVILMKSLIHGNKKR
jgi:hypothetical protein